MFPIPHQPGTCRARLAWDGSCTSSSHGVLGQDRLSPDTWEKDAVHQSGCVYGGPQAEDPPSPSCPSLSDTLLASEHVENPVPPG